MSISLLPDELVKKLLGGQQRITSIAHLIIRDPTGSIEHEFTIGDESAQEEHRDMMQEMSEGDGGHHMSEGGDGMASVTIEPGETKELVWTAPDSDKSLEYACNIPGHYESGMYGNVTVK
ncbi:hypothetical protein SR908_08680 [Chromohalobacter canadensis]|uniref:Copper binding protein, plastocyanin/azurin family n=1 Tax=Chromohalobacter canadensis TaxID=141389 RepID=A0ABZ0Y890_9GAMM|nr:hypothetical protein [Chromohalobacter canadensis]WQH07582.1 hypothetical protein SR908_08680 [Chromohalobacter canadensis]